MEGNKKILAVIAVMVIPYLPIVCQFLFVSSDRHYFSNQLCLIFIAFCMVVHAIGSVLFFRAKQWNTQVTIAHICFVPLMISPMMKVAMTTIVHTYP